MNSRLAPNHYYHFIKDLLKRMFSSLTCYLSCTDKPSTTTAMQELLNNPKLTKLQWRSCVTIKKQGIFLSGIHSASATHRRVHGPVADDIFHVDSDHIGRVFKGHSGSKTCLLQVPVLSIMLNVQPGQAPQWPLKTKQKNPNIQDSIIHHSCCDEMGGPKLVHNLI